MSAPAGIPRVIHRLWLNPPGRPMPAEFVGYGDAWRRLHPGWEVIDWTSLEPFLERFGRLKNQRLFDRAPLGDVHRYRADVVRLELLARIGGVYVDADMEPLRLLEPLVSGPATCLAAISPNRGAGGEELMSNAFLAAVPEHPFILAAIDRLPCSAREFSRSPTARSVGPWHLHRTYKAFERQGVDPGVTLLASHTVYPQSIADRDRGLPVDLSRSYAWHRWATTRDRAARRRKGA